MKGKIFFSLVSALFLGLFSQAVSAQVSQTPSARAWDDQSALVIYVDQQDPSLLHLETRYGQTYSCEIRVTIDFEKKPGPGEPTDANGKIIRYHTAILRAGQKSVIQQFPGIIYYPCHNGMPVVTPGSCNGQTLSASFDDHKFFPTFGMEF